MWLNKPGGADFTVNVAEKCFVNLKATHAYLVSHVRVVSAKEVEAQGSSRKRVLTWRQNTNRHQYYHAIPGAKTEVEHIHKRRITLTARGSDHSICRGNVE